MSSRRTDRPTLLLVAAMHALLIGNFALYELAPLPLPVHIAIAVLGIHLSFTSWHEAVHMNVSPSRWLCDLTGFLAIFPYMAPYYLERWLHLQHHALLNRPDDPNRIYTDGPFWQMPLRYLRIVRFARERFADDPRTRAQKVLDLAPLVLIVALYATAAANGVFWDLVLLWLVPLVISKVVMDWYVNYLPHVGLPPSRFGGTRVIDLGWLTPLVLCHNYHAVHHVWPDVPWHRYPDVFREKRGYLSEHGVPIERRFTGFAPRDERRG